jgi:hypothetical protein
MKPTLLIIICFLSLHAGKAQDKTGMATAARETASFHNFRTVAIEDFFLQRLSGARVMLTWHTKGSDTNGFVVERKMGYNELFFVVGFIEVKASSGKDGIVDYEFTDPNNYKGVSYYRIRQKDSKGTTFYSLIHEVTGKEKQ